jgi:hypothetical protein
MQCNIDAKGKAVRLVIGLVTMIAGGVVFAIGGTEPWAIGTGLGCLAGGGFAVFEGWSGWCAVRALGFKTPL